jgi:membrane protease YdiL (CAAX protease family)
MDHPHLDSDQLTPLASPAAIAPPEVSPVPAPLPRPLALRVLNFLLPCLAWFVILALVGYIVARNMAREASSANSTDQTAWLVTLEQQGRYLVGAADILEALNKSAGPGAAANKPKEDMFKAAKSLDRGSYSQRIRYAILAGEFSGPAEARDALKRMEAERSEGTLTARDISVEAVRLLDRLYEGYQKNPENKTILLDAAEQEKLRSGLRWFGDLALAPEGGDVAARAAVLGLAWRTAITYFVVVLVIMFGLVVGLAIIFVLVFLAWVGRLRAGLATGFSQGGVYAETFALYMLIYFGIGIGLHYLRNHIDLGGVSYLIGLAAMLFSLVALAWPVLRGVTWGQVCEDIGLDLSRPWRNAFFGVVTYLSAYPLLGLGLLIMYLMMWLSGQNMTEPGQGPNHPIVGVALQKNWWIWLQVYLVAAVGAPVVEEIMFRGVLYRHLREASRWLGVVGSVVGSVLISGFIFAVIHPQGWLGVPVLMALATAFALSREWCRSLVPATVAHALNNGLTLTLLLLVAG